MASVFLYTPSHVLPAVFAALSGLSCAIHVYQNSRYHYWKLTLWMVWAGIVFTVGWIIRCINSYYSDNLNLYITQTVLIYAGPPIYAVAEYHVLGRLLGYLPYHSPLNPRFTFIVFIYASAAMETLIAAGASTLGAAHGDIHNIILGGTLISIALVLQAAVELLFFALVVLVHVRCWRDSVLPKNVRTLIYMLYGTSLLVLLRCILRAIGSFATTTVTHCNYSVCQVVLYHEWYLYAFEAGPMIIYTYWVNLVHPGRLLPIAANRYLDLDGGTERLGPGWIDKRRKWAAVADPLDVGGLFSGRLARDPFWERPDEWPEAPGGSFAQGTGSNVREKK